MATIELSATTAEAACDVVIVGAGAAGLIAALRAVESGASVLVLERDKLPRGSTALSAGLVPAAGTRFQAEAGIEDREGDFIEDIMAKSHGEADQVAASTVVRAVGRALEWLHDRHGLPFSVIQNFKYPGHSACRMHGLPSRSGAELMDHLRSAAERQGIDVLTQAQATSLICDAGGAITGVRFARPDGSLDAVGCKAVVLACNGYGGNPARVRRHIPTLAGALYFGHPGNQGDALDWAEALGVQLRHLSGHQGHGSVAHPLGILITWATMTEGGCQVDLGGKRFSDESQGYSEQAEIVLAQPEGVAWSIFDERIAAIARQFEDFRNAEALGAIVTAGDIDELAAKCSLPRAQLGATLNEIARLKEAGAKDSFGRDWRGSAQLAPPFRAVKVTGALFHTQGGLVVDENARVVRADGSSIPNVFAAGGAACGVSGSRASGYLSGNGLLTAVAYGFIAGTEAAA